MGALIGASIVLMIFSGANSNSSAVAAGTETYRQLSIFGDIFERVRAQYVSEPKDEDLIESAISGMLSSLDPHSSYLTAKDFDNMRVQTRGEFGGLGIEVTMENELVKVVTPIDDTPASKAGVLAGDLITKIDGVKVRGLTLQNAVEKMRGPVNTPIVITVSRQGADKPIDITIIRAVIKVRAVHFRIEGGDIGYIRISSFSEQTFSGLDKAIKKIREEVGDDKLKGFVLDLRLTRVAFLIRQSAFPTRFLIVEKSFQHVGVTLMKPDVIRRDRVIPPAANR